MSVHSYLTPKTEVRKSSIDKKSVFAKKLIKKNELISVFGGYIIKGKDYRKLMKKGFGRIAGYSIQVSKDFHLATLNPKDLDGSDFFNHSCNPNTGIKGQILLVAIRDIQPGEEITFDYAMTDCDPDDYFKCNCGAKNCRKVITGNDWKKAELQKKYKGYFSWYIQEKINKLKRKIKY